MFSGDDSTNTEMVAGVNRAFSAKIIWGTFGFLGRRPRFAMANPSCGGLEMRSRLWR